MTCHGGPADGAKVEWVFPNVAYYANPESTTISVYSQRADGDYEFMGAVDDGEAEDCLD